MQSEPNPFEPPHLSNAEFESIPRYSLGIAFWIGNGLVLIVAVVLAAMNPGIGSASIVLGGTLVGVVYRGVRYQNSIRAMHAKGEDLEPILDDITLTVSSYFISFLCLIASSIAFVCICVPLGIGVLSLSSGSFNGIESGIFAGTCLLSFGIAAFVYFKLLAWSVHLPTVKPTEQSEEH